MAAGLRRVRGVTDVKIDRATDEAVVTRQRGTAAGTELVSAVERAGYGARVIPVHRFEFDCADAGCDGCPERLRGALGRSPGVRTVTLPSRTHIVVYYDNRRTGPDAIRRVARQQGFGCASQG